MSGTECKSYGTKECSKCGKEFTAKKKWQRFCSPRCRTEAWDKANPRTRLFNVLEQSSASQAQDKNPSLRHTED